VYVEHSNEVWNGLFAQARYASERGKALGLASDDLTARYRYHALRWVARGTVCCCLCAAMHAAAHEDSGSSTCKGKQLVESGPWQVPC
jgi:hypothetical protein